MPHIDQWPAGQGMVTGLVTTSEVIMKIVLAALVLLAAAVGPAWATNEGYIVCDEDGCVYCMPFQGGVSCR